MPYIWHAQTLETHRAHALNGQLSPALVALREQAAEALSFAPVSVIDKDLMPPSGDKHDYMSVGPYWWPDPNKPDGLPYIRRDGVVNPDRHKYDNARLDPMCGHVVFLSLASSLFNSDMYAQHAAKLLRVWFLDTATRMNPNLEFGQAIPGICDGRGVGIIDTAGSFTRLVDALVLLETSSACTTTDQPGMKTWMRDYLTWLLESKKGKDEAAASNNHATYFDMQAIALALYTNQPNLAKTLAQAVTEKRIATQIEPDGAQPHELARTQSRGYSLMNTTGFVNLAILSKHVQVDLWAYQTRDGRNIHKAVRWFIPYIRNQKPWTWQQLSEFKNASYMPLFRQVVAQTDEADYKQVLSELPSNEAHTINLTCP